MYSKLLISGVLLMISLGLSLNLRASELDIALSAEAAQFTFITDTASIGSGNGRLSFGGFFNEDDDISVQVGLMVAGLPAGQSPLAFGLGVKGYATHIDAADDEVFALALGGQARYTIPANMPMHLGAEVFYAPDITTSNDAEGQLDFVFRFELEFIPGTYGFIGYRLFEIEPENGNDYELEDNVHLGVRLSF